MAHSRKSRSFLDVTIPKGERHNELCVACMSALSRGATEEELGELMDKAILRDGLPPAEAESVLQSAKQRAASQGVQPLRQQRYRPERSHALQRLVLPSTDTPPMPEKPKSTPIEELRAYMKALFTSNDLVNIVTNSREEDGKWIPSGHGHVRSVKDVDANGIQEHRPGGAWMHINPVKPNSSGDKDSDVAEYRYALIEWDDVPLLSQWKMLHGFRLPCKAVTHTGNKSLHAIIDVGAKNIDEYKNRVARVHDVLEAAGCKCDRSNKNPSRMTRVAGVARGEARQWLVATNIGEPTYGDWETFTETLGCLPVEPSEQGAGTSSPDEKRPSIQINNQSLDTVVDAAWESVFRDGTEPVLFRRGQHIVKLSQDMDGLHIKETSENELVAHLSHVATWLKEYRENVFLTFPSKDAAKAMLAEPHPNLRELERVVTVPVFGKSGHPICTRGYHSEDRVWYAPDATIDMPEVPSVPTPVDINAARSLLLDDLLGDFPFVSQSDRAHCVGAFITPFVRLMISGTIPLHCVEACSPGTGKSLICDLISMVSTGRPANAQVLPNQEEEVDKVVTAVLREAPPIVLFDNQSETRKVSSPALARTLTAEFCAGRLLGQSTELKLRNTPLWLMTGNNPSFSVEMERRCVHIRIDAKQEMPWTRDRFRHPNIKEWVRENRGQLLRAIHTLVNAWLAAGQPAGSRSLGSFEQWARVIGGILDVAGIPDFLANLSETYHRDNSELAEWRGFCVAWWEKFGQTPQVPSALTEMCESEELLESVCRDGNPRSQATRLGKAIKVRCGRIFGNYRIEAAKQQHGQQLYALICVGPDARTNGNGDGNPVELDGSVGVGAISDGLGGPGVNLGGTLKTGGPPSLTTMISVTSDGRVNVGEPSGGSYAGVDARTHAHTCKCDEKGLKVHPGSPSVQEHDANLVVTDTYRRVNLEGEPAEDQGGPLDNVHPVVECDNHGEAWEPEEYFEPLNADGSRIPDPWDNMRKETT